MVYIQKDGATLFRASGRSRKKKSNFAGFSGTNSRKKRPISREFRRNFAGIFEASFTEKTIGKDRPISRELSEQISLESDWFCAALRNVFNETRRSLYSICQASYRNVKSSFGAYLLYSIACCLPHLRNSVYDDSSFF